MDFRIIVSFDLEQDRTIFHYPPSEEAKDSFLNSLELNDEKMTLAFFSKKNNAS